MLYIVRTESTDVAIAMRPPDMGLKVDQSFSPLEPCLLQCAPGSASPALVHTGTYDSIVACRNSGNASIPVN